MSRLSWPLLGLWLLSGTMFAGSAFADPCGMVPPVYTGPGVPIKRVGPQKTYVFYKNGVQSIVLRPAFSGKVSNFGMLIPFPAAPAIRKVPDNIFSHIAAAVDPPEVRVWVYRRRYRRGLRVRSAKPASKMRVKRKESRRDTVRVVSQEAVGMYQVAVLAAGSPRALKKWMKRNGYVYPKGMDKVVGEYVKARWFFVAVKTRVGGKKGVSPRPGMRRAKARFPRGGSFRGAVQAMGFRFRTRKLVVPMRLSAFNKGRTRNIVYLLTDGPRRIRHINAKFVRRQLSGSMLYRNVTAPLPLRVYGGTAKQLRPYRWRWIQRQRDPSRHNGLAKELFASDLLAARSGKLSLPHEEKKKVLLRIGERLFLRGQMIDRLNRGVLADARASIVDKSLKDLKRMTLSVVDGDFPREILSRENLTFSSYRMPAAKNNTSKYNARFLRPMFNRRRYRYRRGGKLTRWLGPKNTHKWLKPSLRPKPKRRVKRRIRARRRIARLLRQLRNPKRADAAVAALTRLGAKAVPYLWAEIIEDQPIVPRGWAIVALADMGSARIGGRLAQIHQAGRHPLLLRTWAAAARINIAQTLGEIKALLGLASRFPAVRRPLRKRVTAIMRKKKNIRVDQLLEIASRHYVLRRSLAPVILRAGAKRLLKVMLTHSNNQIRRQAAAYLGSIGIKQPKRVARAVVRALRFRSKASQLPWKGGALFIPAIRWKSKHARALVGQLLAWHLWCEGKGDSASQRQIHNNIRSLSLAAAAGYRSPGWRQISIDQWLVVWSNVVGCKGIKKMLAQQGVLAIRRYQSLLGRLSCQ